MTLSLPPLLETFVAALNARDTDALLACFAAGGIVRDRGRAYFGRPAIRRWFEDVVRQEQLSLHVQELAEEAGEPVLVMQVSGNFDGSPVTRRYITALENGKLIALRIAP
ncbi:MAG TPA: nuclear transport factor 2 family protein [Candidatus Synoicihabitans sp.]|nr:nuclear transport factor 2 family protein [Candidatus Synoicihabitans sp.]